MAPHSPWCLEELDTTEHIIVSVRDGIPIEIHVSVTVDVVVGRTHVREVAQGPNGKDGQVQCFNAVAAIHRIVVSRKVAAFVDRLIIPIVHPTCGLIQVDMVGWMDGL